MPSLVLGTAGHIDHGKSSLVKALTGTDPDRLAEEKARGITIELGFARLELPSGRSMGVVDVPGHERFVRQMVAGATGIDVVLLVIAADDGIMPQTREHLAIIELLGVTKGVVALTKSDLVDEEWVSLVAEEVRQLLADTTIESAEVVPVSARTGVGLPELLAALDRVADTAPARQASMTLRLPVDRVFSMAGSGTVVTGTLWAGTAARDAQVEIYPGRTPGRLRSVQVHSEIVEKASAGQRVALNIAGVDVDDISRGDVIAAPGSLQVTDRFDARFTYLGFPGSERPFESGVRVHVHHGTREVLGRVLLIDTDALQPGDTAFAQLRLEEPLMPHYTDRFIVRSYSPVYTIGGGVILDVGPPRRTTLKPHERELLVALESGDIPAAATELLFARALPMTSAEAAAELGVERALVADAFNRAGLERLKVGSDTWFTSRETLAGLLAAVEQQLLDFHAADPRATGIATGALRDRVDSRLPAKVFDAVLERAAESGFAQVQGGQVRHPAAAVTALADIEATASAIETMLTSQGLAPVTLAELTSAAGVEVKVAQAALRELAEKGRIVRLGNELHFASGSIDEARQRLSDFLTAHGPSTAGDIRTALGVSRKYAIPLLEYFDATGLTRRDGDFRELRKR